MFQRTPNLVSIVVPTYNNVQYLPDCLSSLLNQTYQDIEIVIVDDGSTDQCREFVHQWKLTAADVLPADRIIYLQLPRNVKQPGSATIGLFLSRGEFIACQASDDISHPERIAKQIKYLNEHLEIEMLGTSVAAFRNGNLESSALENMNWIVYGRDQIRKSYASGRHCVCDGTIVMRGEVFDRLGGWTRRLKQVSDFEFVGRYVSNGVATDNLRETLYYYRVHSGQTTQRLGRGEEW